MAIRLAGSGPRRYDVGQNHEMNVTPFVDVMLVLLIVFMVAAPLATTTLQLQLPPSGNQTARSSPVFVALTADGQLYVSSGSLARRTTLPSLAADLGTLVRPGGRVFIRADKRVPYGRFVAVMDRLRADGYLDVGLVSEAT